MSLLNKIMTYGLGFSMLLGACSKKTEVDLMATSKPVPQPVTKYADPDPRFMASMEMQLDATGANVVSVTCTPVSAQPVTYSVVSNGNYSAKTKDAPIEGPAATQIRPEVAAITVPAANVVLDLNKESVVDNVTTLYNTNWSADAQVANKGVRVIIKDPSKSLTAANAPAKIQTAYSSLKGLRYATN